MNSRYVLKFWREVIWLTQQTEYEEAYSLLCAKVEILHDCYQNGLISHVEYQRFIDFLDLKSELQIYRKANILRDKSIIS